MAAHEPQVPKLLVRFELPHVIECVCTDEGHGEPDAVGGGDSFIQLLLEVLSFLRLEPA